MTRNAPQSAFLESRKRLFQGWVVLLVLLVAVFAVVEHQRLLSRLQAEASILHRLASQRADQHDAHLTALSALAVADEAGRRNLFLDVAATILRFYPRIEAVDLVPLGQPGDYLTTRAGLPEAVRDIIRTAARASDGHLALRPLPDAPGRYLLVKRSPNTENARFGLALQIDAEALLASEIAFWKSPSVSWGLSLPDGTPIASQGNPDPLQFEKALGSASQPLILRAGVSRGLTDILPPGRVLAVAALATLIYLAAMLGLRQVVRARRAERQAQLSAHEARLAHASRVNALGEMASGMAHELTQPLTAILSQAQAGRHLAQRGDTAALETTLDAIVAQARRGAAILDRLRNWTRPQSAGADPVSLNQAVRNVDLLLRPDAERAGITLTLALDDEPPPVRADPVELEQVIFNLVRNAIDAVAGAAEKQVTVYTRAAGSTALLEVADSGPGVATEVRSRLFEPFVTGKPGGTGLGLALCQRLVERMGGEIGLDDESPGTVFRIRFPQAAAKTREAAE